MKRNTKTPLCGGETNDGTPCIKTAGWGTDHPGTGKCRLHGGASLKGVEHPNFKHGGYSLYAGQAVAEKMAAFPESEALSLLSELTLMRGLLASFLDKFKDSGDSLVASDSLHSVTLLVDNIRKLTDSVVKQRNDTALTAVEIGFIVNRLPDVVMKYVTNPDDQRAFITELFGIVGGGQPSPGSPLRITAVTVE